jgi:hypothetical protein
VALRVEKDKRVDRGQTVRVVLAVAGLAVFGLAA